ncbi:bifunctional phosphopantothenoylcysteine decarboxylase/phosphopantothenate--cysteine ligase CoaBC [Nannocystaceae bacterium ST9]
MSAPASNRLLLIVSGGIAAYKTPDLVRKLRADGFEVQVVTTEAASAFVAELALATVSGRAVRRSLLDPAEEGHVGHIELADWPELVLVAPATADLIARAAAGLANDLAATVLLATKAPVLWAPAMNTNMWRHPATQANLGILRDRGAQFVGPDRGELACGWIGEGRMMDPPILVEAARALVEARRANAGSWSGRRVLVTAGPTRAYLDPVRFVSNASTGVMGFAVAAAAAERGAEVTLIAGPVAEPTPANVRRIDVETGAQMLAACESEFERGSIDVLAMIAAVADLVPMQPAGEKVPKEQVLARMSTMEWTSEVDILASLAARHGDRTRMLGFGAQTVPDGVDSANVEARLIHEGREKLLRKGCHALFVNRVGVANTGFGSPTNAGHLIFADDASVRNSGEPRPKSSLAGWILDELARAWFAP